MWVARTRTVESFPVPNPNLPRYTQGFFADTVMPMLSIRALHPPTKHAKASSSLIAEEKREEEGGKNP